MKEFPTSYPDYATAPCSTDYVRQALTAENYEAAADGLTKLIASFAQGSYCVSIENLAELLSKLPEPWSLSPELIFARAWMLLNLGNYEPAVINMENSAAFWRKQLGGERAAEAAHWMLAIRSAQGVLHHDMGRPDLAKKAFADARRYLPAHGGEVVSISAMDVPPDEKDRLLSNDDSGLFDFLISLMQIYGQSGDPVHLARIAHNLGDQYLEQGEPAKARAWLERALDLKRTLPAPLPLVFTLYSLGACYHRLGLLSEAQLLLDEGISVSKTVGDHLFLGYGLSILADVHRDKEDAETAAELYERARELMHRVHFSRGVALADLGLATMNRRLGRFDQSAEWAQEAKSLLSSTDIHVSLSVSLSGAIASLLMNAHGAAAQVEHLVGRCQEQHMVFEETLGRWYLSLALYRDGDIGGTAEQVQTALAMAAEYRNLAPLSREIPCSISLCRFAFDQGICPEALAGLVRQAPPKALSMILSQVPAARAVVAATGRLTEASTLYVELLGTFRVLRAGKELDLSSARSQKVVQLLKLFAARRNAPVTREQILELVWPGSSPDAADHSFEVSLSALRKLLDTPDSNSLILRRGRGYVLNQDVPIRTDVESFQAHVERGHWWWQRGQITAALAEWQSAEQLYKGDFMEEDPYAEWAEADRERLREQYLEVLSRLGEIELGEGRCDLAVGRANKILAQDPIRETAYRLLMRAHARQGDRAVALRDYQRCVGALLKELNEEPMAETKRLADRIQQGEAV